MHTSCGMCVGNENAHIRGRFLLCQSRPSHPRWRHTSIVMWVVVGSRFLLVSILCEMFVGNENTHIRGRFLLCPSPRSRPLPRHTLVVLWTTGTRTV